MKPISKFEGPVWRIIPSADLAEPGLPARAPVGRFHHSGQIAIYASLSAEGAGIAIRRYLSDGVARMLVPMWLSVERAADESANRAASVVWQDLHAAGKPSPTWAYSDAARELGAEAMLYASRSRPDLSHVVIFSPGKLRPAGPALPFNPG
ncbi:RES family NAD+ phosphorylase [Pseudooceanicola sp. CBS1P-1]|uniref:RES domain-containing protein n=1 Tax=Pseudooceanicola albus TaxID=2692189 RepID=A0A6L7G748_9RHOB|nr:MULTISPECIES: RES family NAD+ phosphorylase [Pseudooceanicola]MBT9385215.1 RES family NAD+ phosphorylase [Pseudooceanicola endophyticus]MXN18493.1 RES domain-containing protein [Pseudooceanicola albus]